MAEGLRDVLDSRNSATYKTSHLKTRVSGLSCGIICRRTDRRTDRHTTTACTALSIASRGKNFCNKTAIRIFTVKVSQYTTKCTSGSAMAEGPRDALVSRNSATYKTSHLKTRVSGLSCGIICRRTDRRTDRHTTTACTAISIASRGKNRL